MESSQLPTHFGPLLSVPTNMDPISHHVTCADKDRALAHMPTSECAFRCQGRIHCNNAVSHTNHSSTLTDQRCHDANTMQELYELSDMHNPLHFFRQWHQTLTVNLQISMASFSRPMKSTDPAGGILSELFGSDSTHGSPSHEALPLPRQLPLLGFNLSDPTTY